MYVIIAVPMIHKVKRLHSEVLGTSKILRYTDHFIENILPQLSLNIMKSVKQAIYFIILKFRYVEIQSFIKISRQWIFLAREGLQNFPNYRAIRKSKLE